MKLMSSKRNLAFIVLISVLTLFGVFQWKNAKQLIHGIYSIVDEPMCLSRVSKQLSIEAKWSAVIGHFETLNEGMSRDSVHKAFENIAPIVVRPYKNYQGQDYEEIVLRLCSEPLNNLVFEVAYTYDGKLINIGQEDSP